MPENEFEKQVRQKMDEFQLEPTASVWQNLEEEIRKKKRRRIIIFFLLPAALVLLTWTSYLLIHHSNTELSAGPSLSRQAGRPDDATSSEFPLPGKPATGNYDKIGSANDPDSLGNKMASQNPDKDRYTGVNSDPASISSPAKINTGKRKLNTKVELQVTEEMAAAAIRGKSKPQRPAKISSQVEMQQQTSAASDETINSTAGVREIAEKQQPDKQTSVAVTEGETATGRQNETVNSTDTSKQSTTPKTDSAVLAPVAKMPGRKAMKWGFEFSLGVSGATNRFLSLDMQKSLDNMYYNSPGSVTSGGSGQLILAGPSSVRSGFSFRGGLVGEWQLSKRSRISAAVDYSYASTRIRVGTRQDSTLSLGNSYTQSNRVDAYYRGLPMQTYTNKFHFIQLPVSYHWQLTKAKSLPLELKLGVSPGYLLATNGLLYDTSYGGVYYRKNAAFTKFHVNGLMGLSVRWAGRHGAEWLIGPELSMDMNKLFTNPVDKKQFLLFGGINARVLIPGKKK